MNRSAKGLEMAWDRVQANRGSGGVDGQSLEAFGQQLGSELNRLQTELKAEAYQPQPVRQRTKRRVPLRTRELIAALNPVLRGWGEYYKHVHVRKLFHQLDGWVRRRIWSHRCQRWRNGGWKQLPDAKLYGEYGLVNLVGLIPSMASARKPSS